MNKDRILRTNCVYWDDLDSAIVVWKGTYELILCLESNRIRLEAFPVKSPMVLLRFYEERTRPNQQKVTRFVYSCSPLSSRSSQQIPGIIYTHKISILSNVAILNFVLIPVLISYPCCLASLPPFLTANLMALTLTLLQRLSSSFFRYLVLF